MGRFLTLTACLLSLHAMAANGQAEPIEEPIAEQKLKSPSIAVKVSASFPTAEIFGVKLVNGKSNKAILSISNEEPNPVTLKFVGGALWTPPFAPQGTKIIRNLTASRYNVEVPAGGSESLPFDFVTDLHPQDLRLELAAMMSNSAGKDFVMQAFNETVSIVDPDTSIFDPQVIFLYIFLLSCASGVLYLFYSIWVAPYFPQKRRSGSGGGDRSKKAAGPSKKSEAAVGGNDGSAVTTGAKTYDADWIPAHHIQRPEAKRAKSGTPKPKTKG